VVSLTSCALRLVLCTQQAETYVWVCGATCFFPLSAILLERLASVGLSVEKVKISLSNVNEESVGTHVYCQVLNIQRKILDVIELCEMCTDHPVL